MDFSYQNVEKLLQQVYVEPVITFDYFRQQFLLFLNRLSTNDTKYKYNWQQRKIHYND